MLEYLSDIISPLVHAATPLSVTIPTAPGLTVGTNPVEYLNAIYTYVVSISGVFALLMLVYSGVEYILAAGRPAMQEAARHRITRTLFGLLLLFSVVLILDFIDPKLKTIPLLSVDSVRSKIKFAPLDEQLNQMFVRFEQLADQTQIRQELASQTGQNNEELKKQSEQFQTLLGRSASISSENRAATESAIQQLALGTQFRDLSQAQQDALADLKSRDVAARGAAAIFRQGLNQYASIWNQQNVEGVGNVKVTTSVIDDATKKAHEFPDIAALDVYRAIGTGRDPSGNSSGYEDRFAFLASEARTGTNVRDDIVGKMDTTEVRELFDGSQRLITEYTRDPVQTLLHGYNPKGEVVRDRSQYVSSVMSDQQIADVFRTYQSEHRIGNDMNTNAEKLIESIPEERRAAVKKLLPVSSAEAFVDHNDSIPIFGGSAFGTPK